MTKKKKTPYARPRWDDVDNFTKKAEDEIAQKVLEHPKLQRRVGELRVQLATLQLAAANAEGRFEVLLEQARCERDEATEHYLELERLFNLQNTRTRKATTMWRKAHPEFGDVLPDLGVLIEWLLEYATGKNRHV